ncbi:uncharacterized protein LOC131629377 [Vicia villosa]|uniref:uncharacterized protein LOC131629377 n=1 Tax=Vicia villosa TaxID=3911 RepID=UPI00273B0142|nr:uncharacterized protein LOC131629377 [Vicia villosa]
MRCKKHITDFTSTVGVCSTCLRERLILLIQAQAQAQTQAQLTRATSRASDEASRNSETNPPPPLVFPRSVSPYVSRRKSDYTPAWSGHGDRRERLFYSTPQLGPTFYRGCTVNSNARSLKKRLSKFWVFSNLFKSRSENFESDPSCERSSSASPSWFSSILPPRRKNKNKNKNQTPMTTEEFSVGARRRYRQSDRGMSPVRTEEFTDECDQCPSGSGYSSESSPWWKKTPSSNVPSSRRSRLGHGKSASGSGIFCMSPLVRASPNRRWNSKGLPPEMAAATDVRNTAVKPHLSAAASFCANRSRKLADFGRVSHNR